MAGKPRWTQKEMAILRENYQSKENLVKKLPNRTLVAIERKRVRLRLIHRDRSSPGGEGKWVKCDTCNKLTYKSYLALKFEHHFCSHICYTYFRKTNSNWAIKKGKGKTINCDFCGKSVYKNPSQLHYTNLFCSRNCFSDFKKAPEISVICAFCGKFFYKKRAEVKRTKHNHFCSPQCGYNYKTRDKNHAWKGGTSSELYGEEFDEKLKESIRKRDNYQCQKCGLYQKNQKRVLSDHHIDDNKKNNNPLNLVSLCNKCHGKMAFQSKAWTAFFYSITHSF